MPVFFNISFFLSYIMFYLQKHFYCPSCLLCLTSAMDMLSPVNRTQSGAAEALWQWMLSRLCPYACGHLLRGNKEKCHHSSLPLLSPLLSLHTEQLWRGTAPKQAGRTSLCSLAFHGGCTRHWHSSWCLLVNTMVLPTEMLLQQYVKV